MFAGSGGFPPLDGSMPRLAPATIFGRYEADLGRGDAAGDSLSVGSAGSLYAVSTSPITVCVKPAITGS